MSYLFSRALVAEYLPESCSDGEPSVQSNGSPTQLAYLPPDKMTAFSRPSRYGMTFRPLTADRGEELLMSYLAAFRARTSALPERAQASPASAAECGDTWRGSLARFDHDTSSWKTAQHSLLEDSESFSVIWPRSGMTANGQCWELPTLERRTSATGSGLWPTPVASDISSRSKPYAQGGTPLSLAVKWPTPTARCHKGGGNSMTRKDGKSRSDMLDWVVEYQTGMRLNPTWVELLMGWPKDWTVLEPMNDTSKNIPRQDVPCVRGGVQQTTDAEWSAGRHGGVSEAFGLQPIVCQHAGGFEAEVLPVALAQVQGGGVRSVRRNTEAACSSLRSEPGEQRTGQPADALPVLPRLLARDGQEVGPLNSWAHAEPWGSGWEDGVMRVADGVAARMDRLKALGNGQVPACAAAAWRLLTE